MKKKEILTIALICLYSLVGCAFFKRSPVSKDLAAFLGPQNLKIIAEASSASAFLVRGQRAKIALKQVDGFPVIKEGATLSRNQLSRLQSIIFNSANYDFKNSKRCPFTPLLGFKLTDKTGTTHILLCFACNEWQFSHQGNHRLEDFDPARKELITLAHELFPDETRLIK